MLVAWIGNTDLRAPADIQQVGLGPIAQAVDSRPFDEIYLLSNYEDPVVSPYVDWLRRRTEAKVTVVFERLSGPTEFGEIYEAAVRGIERALSQRRDITLSLHLSPGTPAMAAVLDPPRQNSLPRRAN